MSKKKNIYIIGSKGIPAKYGGFETFVEKLIAETDKKYIQYHVACMEENSKKSNINESEFIYNDANCFNISVPNIGPAKAIYYDVVALKYAIKKAKKNNDENPIFYVLACRIGPVIGLFKKEIKKIGGKLYVNPDGHEWKRQKWSKPIRMYWKKSEKMMVKHSDLLICDSREIEKYILSDYKKYEPKTKFISYGTDLAESTLSANDEIVKGWFKKNNLKANMYYLIVGRFVPENNYEIMIKQFMESNSNKDLVIITNVEQNKFFNKLLKETGFTKDKRIKFVGTVYEQDLLKYIRENAFAYLHGHEVGGTNPSLLEALATTKINLLLNVNFNLEVGSNSAYYFEKNNLNTVINDLEGQNELKIQEMRRKSTSRQRMEEFYTWEIITQKYESLFLEGEA